MDPLRPAIDGADAISGETTVYAIVGDPIAQVGSPALFNAAFRRLGLKAVLIPAHVGAKGLGACLPGLREIRNLGGIIVTVPHKIAALDHVDRLSLSGERVGAINVIRCDPDGTWTGANFDGEGCIAGLQSAGHAVAGRAVFVAGAGGAGRAVAHAAAAAGAGRMRLHDPDGTRLGQLCDSLQRYHPQLDVERGGPDPSGFDVAINCTPLGMRPSDPLPFDPERLATRGLVVELIYKPAVTRLMAAASARGCSVLPGRSTLEGQIEPVLRFLRSGGLDGSDAAPR